MEVEIPAQEVSVTTGYQIIITNVVVPEVTPVEGQIYSFSCFFGPLTAPEGTSVINAGWVYTYTGVETPTYEGATDTGPSSDGTQWNLSGSVSFDDNGSSTQIPAAGTVVGYTWLIVAAM